MRRLSLLSTGAAIALIASTALAQPAPSVPPIIPLPYESDLASPVIDLPTTLAILTEAGGAWLGRINTFSQQQIVNLSVTAIPSQADILYLRNVDGVNGIVSMETSGGANTIQGQRQDGTYAAPTALAAGDNVAAISGLGWNGAAWSAAIGKFILKACDAFSTTDTSGTFATSTVLSGSTALAERMRIDCATGGLDIGVTSGTHLLEVGGTAAVAGLLSANGGVATTTITATAATSGTTATYSGAVKSSGYNVPMWDGGSHNAVSYTSGLSGMNSDDVAIANIAGGNTEGYHFFSEFSSANRAGYGAQIAVADTADGIMAFRNEGGGTYGTWHQVALLDGTQPFASVTSTGPITSGKGSGFGSIVLYPGSSTLSGYAQFFSPAGTLLGYIGNMATAGPMVFYSSNGDGFNFLGGEAIFGAYGGAGVTQAAFNGANGNALGVVIQANAGGGNDAMVQAGDTVVYSQGSGAVDLIASGTAATPPSAGVRVTTTGQALYGATALLGTLTSNGSAAVTCSGAPTASFAVTAGIVTHC